MTTYDEDERGARTCSDNNAHSEKNARCGYTRQKQKRAPKPKVERCV